MEVGVKLKDELKSKQQEIRMSEKLSEIFKSSPTIDALKDVIDDL
jgi:hypothetical protein